MTVSVSDDLSKSAPLDCGHGFLVIFGPFEHIQAAVFQKLLEIDLSNMVFSESLFHEENMYII